MAIRTRRRATLGNRVTRLDSQLWIAADDWDHAWVVDEVTA